MPHCARVEPKFAKSRPKAAVNGGGKCPKKKKKEEKIATVESKSVAMGTRQGRRKTLNPVKTGLNIQERPVRTGLNIHERPVRTKKKTPKYETYERDRGVVPVASQPSEPPPEVETNVLLAVGLIPVQNGLNRMHVADDEDAKGTEKPKTPAAADTALAESPKKGVAVAVAASTTVDDAPSSGGNGAKPPSPKVNGVCDSAGDKSSSNKSSSRRSSKEDTNSVTDSKEATSKAVPEVAQPVKTKVKIEEEEQPVESSEPQDLTVTCTSSSAETLPKPFPSAKYISISVEQCQSTPPSVSIHLEEPKRPRPVSGRKRSAKSSDSDENGYKRNRYDDRESAVSEFVEKASSSGLEELTKTAELLQQEIHGLSALARSKELEWNEVIRSKKLKEEMYLRLIRQKQVMLLSLGGGTRPNAQGWDFALENRMTEFFTSDEVSLNRVNKQPRIPSNLSITKSQSGASQQLQRFLLQPQRQEMMQQQIQQQFQQNVRQKVSKTSSSRTPFPILPKPSQMQEQMQPGSVGRQTCSQGPTVDVKTIIADYRQSHPESIPRRGRRMKGAVADNMVSSSRGVLSMSSLAFGSGSQVRTVGSTSGPEESSRPSSADSSRSEAVSYKDVLVQYAKMNNTKPPPPYPEVTLHPVMPGASQSPPPHTSLLHGILTKTGTPAATSSGGKPTTFSPTLARLLTTPDRPSTTTTITTAVRGTAGTSSSSSTGPVSISELLSSSRKRNELTITPVCNTKPAKVKDEAVSGSHDDDDGDRRLVIDEGFEGDVTNDDAEIDPPDAVPECQGCHLKPALFVCAGCGNQWYCSRECQPSPMPIEMTMGRNLPIMQSNITKAFDSGCTTMYASQPLKKRAYAYAMNDSAVDNRQPPPTASQDRKESR